MKKISNLTHEFLTDSYIDAIDIAVVDFKNKKIEQKLFTELDCEKIYFDLASVSKPLINGIGFLENEKNVSAEAKLVLNHSGGLPAWGLLPKHGWREIVNSYSINESKVLYSDYSALRFMLELEKAGINLRESSSKHWDKEILFWKDLKPELRTIQNGFISGKPNYRSVHDPNAFVIDDFVSHAGLFGTAMGIANTLLGLNDKFNLLEKMKEDLAKSPNRFINGWDRAENLSNTFAGIGCSECTFGHLGFTGTSVWIDAKRNLGHIILGNGTKYYWYDKKSYNIFRKKVGGIVWEDYC